MHEWLCSYIWHAYYIYTASIELHPATFQYSARVAWSTGTSWNYEFSIKVTLNLGHHLSNEDSVCMLS